MEGDIPKLKIECLDNAEIADFKSLSLVKVQRAKHQKVSEAGYCFTWFLDAEEILTIVGLIDGLLDGSGSGHQYLYNDGDCFVIVLSFNE